MKLDRFDLVFLAFALIAWSLFGPRGVLVLAMVLGGAVLLIGAGLVLFVVIAGILDAVQSLRRRK